MENKFMRRKHRWRWELSNTKTTVESGILQYVESLTVRVYIKDNELFIPKKITYYDVLKASSPIETDGYIGRNRVVFYTYAIVSKDITNTFGLGKFSNRIDHRDIKVYLSKDFNMESLNNLSGPWKNKIIQAVTEYFEERKG